MNIVQNFYRSIRPRQFRTVGLLAALLVTSIAAPLKAEIGSITVDDETLSPALFTQSYNGLGAPRPCPPISDDQIREYIVTLHLLAREGERLGLAIKGADLIGVEDKRTALERLPTSATSERRSRLEAELLWNLSSGYRDLLIGKIVSHEVAARYTRAIKEKDPRLVDVVMLRYTMHQFKNEQARAKALRALERGVPYEMLAATGLFGSFDKYDDEEWRLIENWTRIEPTADKLSPGDIAVVTNFDASALHVTDTKVLSRIRPHQLINGDELHVWRIVYNIIKRERAHKLETRLREEAVVKEDGVTVFAHESYPVCPEQ